MYGNNPVRSPEFGDGTTLSVKSIFPTLQGEGPYVGWPSIFIRLGGCNLTCNFCDTDFEEFEKLELTRILERVAQFAHQQGKRTADLVVITGGEPLRQPIAALCEQLLEQDYLVQIETNGTLFRPLPYGVDIVCSPKPTQGVYHPLREDLLERITALKFIISAQQPDYAHVPEIGQERFRIPIYVQAMDEYDEEKNKANLSRALQLAMAHGYRLSLQTHKLLNIP
jgi:7-carboxy-7-deazaguanine synthase